MTRKQEDEIIKKAQKNLERRSINTIYFSETGGGCGKVSIHAYILQPNGEKAYYRRYGDKNEFSCTMFSRVSFKASELPKEMLFSFRHGTHFFYADESLNGYKWGLMDLEYEVVDKHKLEEEQMCFMKTRNHIDKCKSIGDVYKLYDKYLRDRPIPYDIIFKAFKIIKYEPNDANLFNGEIGIYAFNQSFAFVSIMEGYGKENNLK